MKVNPKMIRKQGKIPAVFYGAGQETTSISVGRAEFTKALKDAGESSIISLKTPKGALDALIHDVALDPVMGDPIHVDFCITFTTTPPSFSAGAIPMYSISTSTSSL